MGGRSGTLAGHKIKGESQHGEWRKVVDKDTGAIKWIRKRIKIKK